MEWGQNQQEKKSELTMEYVEMLPDKLWNWDKISRNLNLTMEYVEIHPDKPWDSSKIDEVTNDDEASGQMDENETRKMRRDDII